MATSKKSTKAKPATDFLSSIGAPAKRALEQKGITTLKKLSSFTEDELLQLHGFGKSTIPKLQLALKAGGLTFKKNNPEATTTKASETAKVDAYMKSLKHPLKNVVEAVRQVILSTDKQVGEEIYWNAPSFFYTGKMKPFNPKEYKRFIVTFNLFKKDCLRLIFLTGAKVNDTTGFLEGDYADGRRLAMFYNLDDVKSKEKILKAVIKKWLSLLDK
ncbi:MAG: DUF1801 domain-containing protein [Bacteroidota bacterium]